MVANKNAFWQTIRGLCIICVILIHCTNPINIHGDTITAGTMAYWIIERNIVNCAVAVFIFLSGYFTKRDRVTPEWIRKRFIRLVIPFLIWNVIYTLPDILMHRGGTESLLIRFAKNIISGGTAPQFYYIIVMLQLTVITPFLIKLWDSNKNWVRTACFMITPIYYGVLIFIAFYTGKQLPHYQVFFLGWLIYYLLGLFKPWGNIKEKLNVKTSLIFVVATFALGCLSSVVLLKLGFSPSHAISQLRLANLIYSVSVIVLLVCFRETKGSKHKGKFYKCIEVVGDYSYGMFYIHYLVVVVIKHAITIQLYGVCPLFVVQLIECLFCLSGSLLLCFVIRRIIGKNNARLIFGI